MNSEAIFAMGLGLVTPWEVTGVEFKDAGALFTDRELHIQIGFARGSQFLDEAGVLCDVHDTKEKTWRHLNFFQHKCYIHCQVPRIKTSNGKVLLVDVPWSRKESGFTLLFEGYALKLIENEMPINKVGEVLGEYANRIWTIFNYWIKRAYQNLKIGEIKDLGIDETSRKRGHEYLTIAVDLMRRRVIHATPGKDSKTVQRIREYLEQKGVDPMQIEHASIDLSPAFISGLEVNFPYAEIHFDRFHVKKLLNEAMNQIRQAERKEHALLKGHKYTSLKNPENLSANKQNQLAELIKLYPTLGEAYRLKLLFDDIWQMPTPHHASLFLDQWVAEVEAQKIGPFMKFARTVMAHKHGIINFCVTQISNGILEGINNKIQLAKRRARGYRNTENFINMIYFLCGKLNFTYPLKTT